MNQKKPRVSFQATYTTVAFPAGLNRKLITARAGRLALAVPSVPTVTVAGLILCCSSVYHACTLG